MEQTAAIAEFVCGTQYGDIPPRAIDAGKEAILDTIGVALAGSQESPGLIAAEVAREEHAQEEAVVFGHGFRSSAMMAAFANGASSHALDYDGSFAIGGQPMAGLVATVFALGEPLHATGRQLLAAYVLGFEVTAKLAWAASSGSGGWHATGTLGSIGCAAAAARLLQLDADQTRMALAVASSMASGGTWNFGTMSKPLHSAIAARNGVLAAKLAQKGFTGNDHALEAGGGFLQTYMGGKSFDPAPFEELGKTFDLERGVRFKAYPCGGLTHSAIDAVLALRHEHHIAAESVDRIDVRVTAAVANRIVFRVPETELQSKFSMGYILARAILDGEVTLDTFAEPAIREPAALSLLERVHMEADPELTNDGQGGQPCTVEIHLKDGRTLFRRVDRRTGTYEHPFGSEDLQAKFVSCAQRALSEAALRDVRQMVSDFEKLGDIRSLAGLLAGTAPVLNR